MPWNDHNDNDGPRNPWGSNGNNTPDNSAWGNGGGNDRGPRRGGNGGGNGGNGGGTPPDFDEILRKAQQYLRNILPGDMGVVGATLLAVAAGLVLWLASGFYFIQPNENGVVLTFGKYTRTEERAGLKYALPWPVQQIFKVDVTSERRVEVGFNSANVTGYRATMGGDNMNESLMLTGDENIINIDYVVMWRIGDAREFLFEIRNPEDTIKLVAESAMREVIARSKITAALTEGRGQIQADTKALMQKILDDYHSGITINNIQLLKVDPPDPVIDAFNDVQRARTEAERMQNEAQAYRNDIIPRARGEAQKTLEDAEAYKQETIARAKGDADRFNSVYAAYSKSKDVTTERIYLETLQSILQSAKTIVMDNKGAGNGVVPYLPINELGKRNSLPPAPDAAK